MRESLMERKNVQKRGKKNKINERVNFMKLWGSTYTVTSQIKLTLLIYFPSKAVNIMLDRSR